MKVRNGFVSNSSSSSFTCDVSGRTTSGWDLCLSEAGMYECVNGHTIDEEYVIGNLKELAAGGLEVCLRAFPQSMGECLQEAYDEYREENDSPPGADDMYDLLTETLNECDGRYELPAGLCPLCTLKYVNTNATLRYLLNRMGRTYTEVCDEIRETHGDNPTEFYDAIEETSLKVTA